MQIISEIDLDELLTLPSNSLYNILSSIKKDAFADDERVILNAQHELSESFVSYLKWVIDYVDIPTFFIIVKTNNARNKELLNFLTIENLDKSKEVINHGHSPDFEHHSRCAYLNAGLHVWPDGKVSPCCDYNGFLKDDSNEFLNIHKQNLLEIFNSDSMNFLRKEFSDNRFPVGCNKCLKREELNLASRRTLASYRLKNIYGKINWEGGNEIQYIGAHPTNLCNLSCRICTPRFSSLIEAEDKKQGIINEKLPDTIGNLYDQLNNYNFRVFEILGGEPFIMEKNLKFIESLITKGIDKESIFSFTTNGMVFPNFFNKEFDFKLLEITFSIDDIGKRFEYQRNKASWDTLLSNLEKFKEFKKSRDNVMLGVNVTVNILNVLYLPELYSWYKEIGLDHIHFSLLDFPEYLSIKNLTDDAKKLIISKLPDDFDFIKEIINSSQGSNGEEFIKNIKIKDKIRNQNLSLNHAEIAKAMGYH